MTKISLANSNSLMFFKPVLPPQKLPESEKTDQWAIRNIDAIQAMGNVTTLNGRSSRYNKKINYDLVNSIFEEEDFNYVINPYGIGAGVHKGGIGNSPSKLRSMNLLASKVNLLVGEEMNLPFDWQVIGVGGEVLNSVNEARNKLYTSMLRTAFRNEAQKSLVDPESGEVIAGPDMTMMAREFEKSYRDKRETQGNNILQYLIKKEQAQDKFNRGFKHAIISSEEIYYVGLRHKDPGFTVVNPLHFDFDKSADHECIEKAMWAREDRWMTVSEILDEYAGELDDDLVRRLDAGEVGSNSFFNSFTFPEFAYPREYITHAGRMGGSLHHYHNFSNGIHRVLVSRCVWKSMRKVGFLKWVDAEDGEEMVSMVDETFKMSEALKESGAMLEWIYIGDVWQGTKIGHEDYVQIGPIENQVRNPDNPAECQLPYVGRVYNALNSKATSVVDLLKPHQYLYMIIWYRMESEIAKSKGKALIMDLAQLPKSKGISMKEWLYFLDTMGVAFINSWEEGEGAQMGKTPTFNGFTQIDRTISDTLSQYLVVLDRIEKLMGDITGITPQREGAIKTSETVGGVERSVRQSSSITEPWFNEHNMVKTQVLTHLLEAAKIAYRDGKNGQFITDEGYRIMLDVDGEMFADSTYGVFVTNSSSDKQILEQIRSLGQIALQQKQAEFKDVVKVFKTNSIAEIEAILDVATQEQREFEQSKIQQQNEGLQQVEAQRQAFETDKLDREDVNKELDRQAKIAVAQIQALSRQGAVDTGNPDIVKLTEIDAKMGLEREKLQVKREEIASKERNVRTQEETRKQISKDSLKKDNKSK